MYRFDLGCGRTAAVTITSKTLCRPSKALRLRLVGTCFISTCSALDDGRVHVHQVLCGLHGSLGQVHGKFAARLDLHRQHIEAAVAIFPIVAEGDRQPRVAEFGKNDAGCASWHDHPVVHDEVHGRLDLLGYLETAHEWSLGHNLAVADAHGALPCILALVKEDDQPFLIEPADDDAACPKADPNLSLKQEVEESDDALTQAEAARKRSHQSFR
mmetsp:Transcript_3247/g.7657  ORF Transcript_3247/g.7657 Transcript_3247/m.7657 type:complete len:214 (+) Transcript_3247:108-749(+)